MKFYFSEHSSQEMLRRGIPKELVDATLINPEQMVDGDENRIIYQSRHVFAGDRRYLIRVVVDSNLDPPCAITVYRTSKIAKYWRL